MRGVKKENLPTKTCVTCQRPFTWRKKWEKVWEEVTTCSKSCNRTRRRDKQRPYRQESEGEKEGESIEFCFGKKEMMSMNIEYDVCRMSNDWRS